MKGKTEIVGHQHRIYTNDDEVIVELVLKRDQSDPFFSSLIKSVDLRLVCEGKIVSDGEEKSVKFYESKPVPARCNYTTRGHATYSVTLKFPASNVELPSSFSHERTKDRILWLVRAVVNREGENSTRFSDRPVTFTHSAELPNLFSLIDTEHIEEVNGDELKILTTHATAGLPQAPLPAGIGLVVQTPNASSQFSIRRLRVLLCEFSTLKINGVKKELPMQRWLVHDKQFARNGVKLEGTETCLDDQVSQVCVEHARLAPSFSNSKYMHQFELVVELTVSWLTPDGRLGLKRVSSASPVNVLPRVVGAEFIGRRSSIPRLQFHNDSTEITDSSDSDGPLSETSTGSTESVILASVNPDSAKKEFENSEPSIAVLSIYS